MASLERVNKLLERFAWVEPIPPIPEFLLLEDGTFLLLEDGSKILLE